MGQRMKAPESGVRVRMYRVGHGDCFLLAFRGDDGDPIYVLIDCGRMGGSDFGHGLDVIAKDIADATGGHLHVVVATHEHSDHVGGFRKKDGGKHVFDDYFETIEKLWVAWTEDPDDELANELRDEHGDVLFHLLGAMDRLQSTSSLRAVAARNRMLDLLDLEVAHDGAQGLRGFAEIFAAGSVKGKTNKEAIQIIQRKTGKRPLYLRPHRRSYYLPGASKVRVYALGPPRSRDLLYSEDPTDAEEFEREHHFTAQSRFLLDRAERAGRTARPFAPRYGITDPTKHPFFRERYLPDSDAWRQIDEDWLGGAEALALRLNRGINNTSLVLAFELEESGNVLLFAADAQRGNWVSWNRGTWDVGGDEIDARSLLARTVLYKVGHHGSHNATLNGTVESDWANLSWFGEGAYRDALVAMLPANEEWATTKRHPWIHPLPSIEKALSKRTRGRLFRADEEDVKPGSSLDDDEAAAFEAQKQTNPMWIEYTVLDR